MWIWWGLFEHKQGKTYREYTPERSPLHGRTHTIHIPRDCLALSVSLDIHGFGLWGKAHEHMQTYPRPNWDLNQGPSSHFYFIFYLFIICITKSNDLSSQALFSNQCMSKSNHKILELYQLNLLSGKPTVVMFVVIDKLSHHESVFCKQCHQYSFHPFSKLLIFSI